MASTQSHPCQPGAVDCVIHPKNSLTRFTFTLRDMTWFAFWSQFAQITNMLQPHSNRNSICLSWVWLSRSWIKGTCSLIRKGMVCKTCIPAVHSTSLHNDRKSIYKAQLVRSVLESRDATLIWTNGIDTITSLPTGSRRPCCSTSSGYTNFWTTSSFSCPSTSQTLQQSLLDLFIIEYK